MEYMTIKEAAAKWGLSERRIQEICELDKVPGVTKFGRAWAIPVDAEGSHQGCQVAFRTL